MGVRTSEQKIVVCWESLWPLWKLPWTASRCNQSLSYAVIGKIVKSAVFRFKNLNAVVPQYSPSNASAHICFVEILEGLKLIGGSRKVQKKFPIGSWDYFDNFFSLPRKNREVDSPGERKGLNLIKVLLTKGIPNNVIIEEQGFAQSLAWAPRQN